MRTSSFTLLALLASAVPVGSFAVQHAPVDPAIKTATVMIANYADDANKTFLGWGSGFFVDEGIVVTNKHVIEGGDWYRVYVTGPDFSIDKTCSKNITKSDVKVNLDDDVAYMRVFLPCDHTVVRFAQDPEKDDPAWIVGYPFRESYEKSLVQVSTTGSVLGMSQLGWMRTDAHLDFGNSGGPVANQSGVIGVAVAKGVDENSNFVAGYFIPSSVIENGLLYANDSRFGYTPQGSKASLSRSSKPLSSVSSRFSSSLSQSSFRSSIAPSRSSAISSSSASYQWNSFEGRTCARVAAWFAKSASMKARVNERLLKRFGFSCL